jgi:hypothetical protein
MRCNHTYAQHHAITTWIPLNDAAIEEEQKAFALAIASPPVVPVVAPVVATPVVVAQVVSDVVVAAETIPLGETTIERRRRAKREASRRHRARVRRQQELGNGYRLLSGVVISEVVLARRATRAREMGRVWRIAQAQS